MAVNLNKITGFLKEAKEVLGIVGVLGDLLAFFAKLPSGYALLPGLLGSLLIFMWGWFERNNVSNLFKTLARIGVAVGVITFVFFAAVGAVLLLSSPPTSFGRITDEKAKEFRLASGEKANSVTGQYNLKIDQDVDLVEVGVMPSPDDLNKVKELDVTTEGPIQQTNKMTLLVNRTNDTQTYYRVTDPTANFEVKLNLTVDLKEAMSSPEVGIRVYYKYGKRDLLWRVTSWVFERFG